MKIAHLSDLHVTEGPALEDQAEDLARLVARVLEARPDLVILSGDYYGRTVPHRPSPRERAVLEPMIVRLADVAPVLVLEGNHDHGEALALAQELGGVYPVTVLDRAGSKVVHTPAGPARVYWLAYPTKRWLLSGQRVPGVAEARAQALTKIHGLLTAWGGRMRRQRAAEPDTPILFAGHFQVAGSVLSSGEILATGELEIERTALQALPVDYGALGHVHKRQELAPRWWYVGNPWPVDFGETGARGFHLVKVGPGQPPSMTVGSSPRPWDTPPGSVRYPATTEGLETTVAFQDGGARAWSTVRYRWSSDREAGEPRWITRPTDAELEALAGQVVRARLTVPDVHATTCPWDAEIARLEDLAHRVKAERVIEPTVRVRAPKVAEAPTVEGKIRAWWDVLETPPEGQDRAAALEALAELQEHDDDQIRATTRELLTAAKARVAPA